MDLLSPPIPNRKEVYRAFLRRFDPAETPDSALKADLIDASLSSGRIDRFAAALLLRPGSQHALLGGIGSGKSTELRLLSSALMERDLEMLPIFIDISISVDLNKSKPGSILVAAALAIESQWPGKPSVETVKTFEKLKKLAHGYSEWFHESESHQDGPDDMFQVKFDGLITPPAEPIEYNVLEISELFADLKTSLASGGKELVMLLDGMDRLLDPNKFWKFVYQDFAAFRKLEISLVTAAPLSLLHNEGRGILDHFDTFQLVPTISLDEAGLTLLRGILSRRQAQELIDSELYDDICRGSGGVLRDLISIVQTASQNAYIESQDHITATYVDAAILQLGQAYKIGLGNTQILKLRKLQQGADFEPSSSENLDLLVSRRILHRKDRYTVHPALLRALEIR